MNFSAEEYTRQVQEAAAYIKEKLGGRAPEIAITLGSGLGDLADHLVDAVQIPYGEIPHFPVSTVAGHKGQFVVGKLEGREVLCMQGRFHYYEGYDLKQVTLPVRVMKLLGISTLIVTNAAGGINTGFRPGNLMLIEDHLNLTGENPLIGENLEVFGDRFFDMIVAYDAEYRALAEQLAAELNIPLQKGVYAWLTGPNYETPAEIRYLRAIGADAVGMSTVPEVLVARHSGLRVCGISCITNLAAGMGDGLLSHEEVKETADRVKVDFIRLVTALTGRM